MSCGFCLAALPRRRREAGCRLWTPSDGRRCRSRRRLPPLPASSHPLTAQVRDQSTDSRETRHGVHSFDLALRLRPQEATGWEQSAGYSRGRTSGWNSRRELHQRGRVTGYYHVKTRSHMTFWWLLWKTFPLQHLDVILYFHSFDFRADGQSLQIMRNIWLISGLSHHLCWGKSANTRCYCEKQHF